MSVIDEAFAAVPRDLWAGGPLFCCPDDPAVARWLAHAGASDPPPAPVVRPCRADITARRARVAELRDAGLSIPQIAATLGVSVYAVDYDMRALRAAEGCTGVAAARNAEHAARRARIYTMLDAGYSYRAVVDTIGVTVPQIRRAVAARKQGGHHE
jgi:transposase